MSSVGSVIAQRPFRGKYYTVLNIGAIGFPTTVIESETAFTGATQEVGNVITFATLANATGTSSGQILNGSAALSAGTVLSGGAAIAAIAAGQQLQDMGRHVHVYLNSQKIYTLSLVQLKREDTGTTEGVDGSGSTGATDEGYQSLYVVTETNLLSTAAPGSSGVGLVGVARV